MFAFLRVWKELFICKIISRIVRYICWLIVRTVLLLLPIPFVFAVFGFNKEGVIVSLAVLIYTIYVFNKP